MMTRHLFSHMQFDTDHSGALSRPEIAEALASMGSNDEEIQVLPGRSLVMLHVTCYMADMLRGLRCQRKIVISCLKLLALACRR